ncbi:hypothetical protein [Streptomyces sp. NPDC048272]|uniref:hypothetical protein n=1 Tax=Streptomyces sp. NPDC048272 TaxID=3154616 RepID=UPI003419170A
MHGQMLGIYLNDHLAGSTAGVGLARRIARAHRRTPRGAELARLANEIAQDRHDLLAIMHALGHAPRRHKVLAGWAGERAARMKLNGRLVRRSGLSRLVELETLRLGTEGKACLWATLLVVAPGQAALDEDRLQGLLDRAQEQIDTLEGLRLTASAKVFTPGRARA